MLYQKHLKLMFKIYCLLSIANADLQQIVSSHWTHWFRCGKNSINLRGLPMPTSNQRLTQLT